MAWLIYFYLWRNDSKYSGRHVLANSVDPDQAGAILLTHYCLVKLHC